MEKKGRWEVEQIRLQKKKKKGASPTGFEPVREDPNGFLVHRLNHSATTTADSYLDIKCIYKLADPQPTAPLFERLVILLKLSTLEFLTPQPSFIGTGKTRTCSEKLMNREINFQTGTGKQAHIIVSLDRD